MPRDIPVGNGRLLICFDADYNLRDLYFPHVGQENHLGGNRCRLGVWVDGSFSWVDRSWRPSLTYERDTLVSRVHLEKPELKLRLVCRDAVDFHENVFIREMLLENLLGNDREVRLFFTHDFSISQNNVGDTATYDPQSGALVHYKGSRYFLAGGLSSDGSALHQFATGQKRVGDKEGTWRDAEDGELSGNPIAQGSVDSVFSLRLRLPGFSCSRAYAWIAAGETWPEVRRLNDLICKRHPASLIKRTADYWRLWINKETLPWDLLPDEVAATYRRSLLVLRTQIDDDGGIIAGNDSDVIDFNRDTYSYIWPRDGALVANALDLAGYPILTQNFYRFCARAMDSRGYLLHKYNPDGTLASSWHPWIENGTELLPIQEDETALVIWALWQHFVLYRNIEFIKPLYHPLIKRSADFLATYRDRRTDLPAPSYDLWEERRGFLSYTTGAVFGGLTAAALFCEVFGEDQKARYYRERAAAIRDAASRHLWREDLGRFCRMLEPDGTTVDPTPDASLWGLFAFGLFQADDPRIKATMEAIREQLWLPTPVGGLARYDQDPYYRTDEDLPGNPWFICTLWLADYLIARARTAADLDESLELLRWVSRHALPSGVLAEQVHPHTGAPLSVSPLTWSHATFVTTTWRWLRRLEEFTPELNLPSHARGEDWIARLFGRTCAAIHGNCRVPLPPEVKT